MYKFYYDILSLTKFLFGTSCCHFLPISTITFFILGKSNSHLYLGLLNMLCISFHVKKEKIYFEQNSWSGIFVYKIKPSIFFSRKISLLFVYLASKYSRDIFQRKTVDILFRAKILSHWSWGHFHPKLKWVFFFFFWKIFFLFLSKTSKYSMFWSKNYYILLWTKFFSGASWWRFCPILTRIFFSHKMSFLFVFGTSKYAMQNFSNKNREILFRTQNSLARHFLPKLNRAFFFFLKISLIFV